MTTHVPFADLPACKQARIRHINKKFRKIHSRIKQASLEFNTTITELQHKHKQDLKLAHIAINDIQSELRWLIENDLSENLGLDNSQD
jgi:hypothetical protein